MYRLGLIGHGFAYSGGLLAECCLAGFQGSLKTQFLKTPMGIVARDEGIDGLTDGLEVAEDPTVDGLFLEGAAEAFGHTVGLGLGDEGEARRDAPEADLVEEVIGGVLGAMVHAQGQPSTGVRGGTPEIGLQAHGDGLQGRKATADLDHMVTDATGIEVIHRREHPHPAVVDGFDTDAIGAPERVGPFGQDGARVRLRYPLARPIGREQVVFAHQTQHAHARDAYAAQDTQPRPDLAVALTEERRGGQIGTDGLQEGRIGHLGLGSAALGMQGEHLRPRPPGVDRRAGGFQHATDPLQAIALAGPRGGLSAHRADLLRPKGRRTSRSRRRISFSITSSPIRRVASVSLSSRGSL